VRRTLATALVFTVLASLPLEAAAGSGYLQFSPKIPTF
jgi:hypothetical protein